jgi:hypothetical protein
MTDMKRLYTILAVVVAAMALISCDKYEDGKPAKSVRAEFNKMYPDAKDVEWEPQRGFWVVSFETGTPPDVVEHDAWYDVDGGWIRTETEVYADALPQAVLDAIAASEYASAVIDRNDVVYVETPQAAWYRLELFFGGVEIHVDVTEEGKVSLSDISF